MARRENPLHSGCPVRFQTLVTFHQASPAPAQRIAALRSALLDQSAGRRKPGPDQLVRREPSPPRQSAVPLSPRYVQLPAAAKGPAGVADPPHPLLTPPTPDQDRRCMSAD